LRAAGDTRTPLVIGALTNLVNVLFLYMFVYGGFGVPQIGIAGAALAGGLADAVAALLTMLLWRRRALVIARVARPSIGRARASSYESECRLQSNSSSCRVASSRSRR
jgi:Na+-driven multidrug efflux pump